MRKTFILGVGAQKAGTTWLHKQLINCKFFNGGFAKEYHIFDALTLKECRTFLVSVQKICLQLLASDFNEWRLNPALKILSFFTDTNNYFDYFERCLKEIDCDLTADITPSYSGLSEQTFKYIKDEFNKRGVAVKVIFLMREPVTRLLSAHRMYFRKQGKTIEKNSILRNMKSNIGTGNEEIRSNYRNTYTNLINVFDEDELFFSFYETIFTSDELNRLSNFLNTDQTIFNTNEKINTTKETIKMEKVDIEMFKEHFIDRYEFVKTHFSKDIYNIWMDEINKL